MKTLGELLDGLVDEQTIHPHHARVVSGVFDDSRRVQPDGIFVALRGSEVDGRRFVGDALHKGAAIVISEGLEPRGAHTSLPARD